LKEETMKNTFLKANASVQPIICPLCKSGFGLVNNSFICSNNHTFDIARLGYINFLNKPVKSIYTKSLYQSRQALIKNGFFNSLEQNLKKLVIENITNADTIAILDAGCGEGSIFINLLQSIRKYAPRLIAIGADSSKTGIQIANKQSQQIKWLVCDTGRLPIQDNSVDIILNILSPANYHEFNRILKDDGTVIKAIPNKEYLRELREITGTTDYKNDDTIGLFKDNTKWQKKIRVADTKELSRNDKLELIRMTPLTSNKEVPSGNLIHFNSATIDLTILVGQKRK
jgi:23S rRNA (guanine745-N1)-methyltransferase